MHCILLKRILPFLIALFLGVATSTLFTSNNESKNKPLEINSSIGKSSQQTLCVSHHGCRSVSPESLEQLTQALEKQTGRLSIGKCKNGDSYRLSILKKPRAEYTPEAREAKASGAIRLQITFTASGEILNIKPINVMCFGLTEQAIVAARKIEFEPEIRCGKPVSVTKVVEYNFNLY